MRESLMSAQAVAVLEPPVTEGERSEAGGASGLCSVLRRLDRRKLLDQKHFAGCHPLNST